MIRLRHIKPSVWTAASAQDTRACAEWPLGAVVQFEPVRPRSGRQERFWFAVVRKAWENLPDELQARFPDEDALRAHVLIKAGWCESKEFVYDSVEAAVVGATQQRWSEPYSIVKQDGTVLFVYKAKSQSRQTMKSKEFKDVTDRGLTVLAEILGCDPVALLETEAA